MPLALDSTEFLTQAREYVVIDVRTPAEFAKGHIPGAFNLPLFSNEERVVVGTIYKQIGKKEAIDKGLEFVIPKLTDFTHAIKDLTDQKKLLIHCWRGGMRSGSVALLMEKMGYTVYTLKGGYKYFRRFVLSSFEKKYKLMVLGGKTGSSKSKLLESISDHQRQVIFLEKLAHHKGSSYGHIGEPDPPTQEQFENSLAMELFNCNHSQTIWLEDESRLIGKKVIPDKFFLQMREARTLYLDVAFEDRVKHLTKEYGDFPSEELIDATKRIERRLGPQQTKEAIQAIQENRMEDACRIILIYYDKTYAHGLSKRDPDKVITVSSTNSVKEIIELADRYVS